jgi:hypothetical protein
MDQASFNELIAGVRVYKLSTLADIVEAGYLAGVRPRERHLFPTFANHVASLPGLLRLAYDNGLEPTDLHFDTMGARMCPVKLVEHATSLKLTLAHGRQYRYPMKWDLHVRDRPVKERAELLAVAYASSDIVPDFRRHVEPLGEFLCWRALAAAYAAGSPVAPEHAFELAGDLSGVRHSCPPRQRAYVAPVLLAWITAGHATRLEHLPVQWISTAGKRGRVLRELYARNCVPRRRHLFQYGAPCQDVVKKARRRYARASLMQRKCLATCLPTDIAELVYAKIRASDV